MKSMYDVPLTAEIVQDQYGDECFVNIVFMTDETIWVNTLGERELSGPYHCDDDEAVRLHMNRSEKLNTPPF